MSDKSEWASNPYTLLFVDKLRADYEELCSLWGDGAFTGATVDETVQLNARSLGMAQAILQMIEWIKEEEEETEDEVGSDGVQSPDQEG